MTISVTTFIIWCPLEAQRGPHLPGKFSSSVQLRWFGYLLSSFCVLLCRLIHCLLCHNPAWPAFILLSQRLRQLPWFPHVVLLPQIASLVASPPPVLSLLLFSSFFYLCAGFRLESMLYSFNDHIILWLLSHPHLLVLLRSRYRLVCCLLLPAILVRRIHPLFPVSWLLRGVSATPPYRSLHLSDLSFISSKTRKMGCVRL